MPQSKFNDILTIGLQNVVETLTYYHTFCPADRYFTISLFYKLFSSFLFSKNFSPQKVTKKVQRKLTANLFYFSVTEICPQSLENTEMSSNMHGKNLKFCLIKKVLKLAGLSFCSWYRHISKIKV